MALDQFLHDFNNAIASSDVKGMEQLFLAPDDTADGMNRQENLTELQKDWGNSESGPPIELTTTSAVITLDMTDLDPEGPPTPRVTKLELNLVHTETGWRIQTMR